MAAAAAKDSSPGRGTCELISSRKGQYVERVGKMQYRFGVFGWGADGKSPGKPIQPRRSLLISFDSANQ